MPEQTPGHDGVRLVIDNMNRVDPKPESASGAEPEAPPATGGGKGGKGAKNGRGIAFKPLEPDCPVKALGKKGKDYFYQNADGEFMLSDAEGHLPEANRPTQAA